MTEAGEPYFRHCANTIREIELAEAALQSTAGKPSGVLKVTAPVDVGHTLPLRIVHAYAAKYPEVPVELLVTNRVIDLVGEETDLPIRPPPALRTPHWLGHVTSRLLPTLPLTATSLTLTAISLTATSAPAPDLLDNS